MTDDWDKMAPAKNDTQIFLEGLGAIVRVRIDSMHGRLGRLNKSERMEFVGLVNINTAIERLLHRARIARYWSKEHTCTCGLYVHPDNPHTSKDAIHITDCPFAPFTL